MPLLNASPLALPSGADTEGAWQEAIDPPNPAPGNGFSRTTPGETYEQVLTGNVALLTDATAGARQIFVAVVDANGVQVMTAAAPAPQGPSFQVNYSLHGDGGQSYNPTNPQQVLGFPPVLLLPGWKFQIIANSLGPGDQFFSIGLLYLRIPTRAPRKPAEIILPTPMVT